MLFTTTAEGGGERERDKNKLEATVLCCVVLCSSSDLRNNSFSLSLSVFLIFFLWAEINSNGDEKAFIRICSEKMPTSLFFYIFVLIEKNHSSLSMLSRLYFCLVSGSRIRG